jgi:hypothetical protein
MCTTLVRVKGDMMHVQPIMCEPLVLTCGNLYDMNDEFEHDRPDIDLIEAPIG